MSTTTRSRKRKLQSELNDGAEVALDGPPVSLKRAATTAPKGSKRQQSAGKKPIASKNVIDLTDDVSTTKQIRQSAPRAKGKSTSSKEEGNANEVQEKRLRNKRSHPPKSYLEKLERAQTQRMIVVDRARNERESCPTEDINIVGTTGNIYKVTVSHLPSCTCPDSQKGHQCKHIVYALHTVLRAPEDLQYQLAFLSSELREIFAHAPPIPTETASSNDSSGNRKPIEGECPICYMDFDPDNNELVWCKAACGNNMHKSCFDQWKRTSSGGVKCVYCRTPWQTDAGDVSDVIKSGQMNAEGYVNVAEQFGMSGMRDYSSYHQPWVRRNFGNRYARREYLDDDDYWFDE
ncbi:MAG: hypothetical protein Q9227_000759 [Pyrenula ochraceoflavens]